MTTTLAVSRNREANLPVNAAAAGGHDAVVKLLVTRGCPVDARGSDQGYTALHLAAFNGNQPLAAWLVARGARKDLPTAQGETASALAARRGHATLAKELA